MRNSFGLRWLATLGLVLVPATAMSSGPFDGSWSVVVACAQAPDGAKAYRWNFTAQVRDGSFLGQYNQPGKIPSGTLSGQIQPTGNAHLTMDGLTGDPDYSLSRVHAGTPIHYTATAQNRRPQHPPLRERAPRPPRFIGQSTWMSRIGLNPKRFGMRSCTIASSFRTPSSGSAASTK
jgi:hypothetical protein